MQKRGIARQDQAGNHVSKRVPTEYDVSSYGFENLPTATMFAGTPKMPRLNFEPFTALLPVDKLIAIGIAYAQVKQMTPTPENALKAAELPK